MAVYEYTGLDAKGAKKTGYTEARDSKAAKILLFDQGIVLTRLLSVELKDSHRSWPLSQMAMVSRQIALFLKMGYTLDDAFLSTAQGWKRGGIQKKLTLISYRLKEGLDLDEAIKGTDLFPGFFLKVLSVARKTGKVSEALESLAAHCEKKDALRNLWIQGLIYPGILFVVSMAVLGIVFQWVFPSLVELFEQSNRPLPHLTKIILFSGRWVWSHAWLFLMAGVFGGYGLFYFIRHYENVWMKVILRIPGLGLIFRKRNACEVAQNVALLIHSGFQVPESFSIAGENHPFLSEPLRKFRMFLEEGYDFNEGMELSGNLRGDLGIDELNSVFPKGFLKMLSVGFKTGSLVEACEKVSKFYERELEIFFSRCMAFLGPVLLLGVGIFIGFIVVGVVLPIFDWSF